MPKLLERFKDELLKKWYDKAKAYAIATAKLTDYGYLKPWTQELTRKWKVRESLPKGKKWTEVFRNRLKKNANK